MALTEATAEAVPVLAEKLGMEAALAPSNSEFARSLGLHVAWLSRLPIRRTVRHALPALSKTLLEIEVEGTSFFATHLASRHEDVTHPRSGEVRAILGVLSRCTVPHVLAGDLNALTPGDPVGAPPPGIVPRGDALPDAPRDVLVGDLNALTVGDPVGEPPAGVEKRGEAVDGVPRLAIGPLLEAGYVDCYRALHDDPGYTYSAEAPWLRLDYVFASRTIARRLRGAGVVSDGDAARASDHLPVWAEFR